MGSKEGDAAPDAVEQFERMTEVAGKAQQMMLEFWTGEGAKLATTPPEPDALAKLTAMWGDVLTGDWAKAWASADTAKLVRMTGDYWTDAMQLWAGMFLGGTAPAVPEAAKAVDKRFKGEAWEAAPVFDLVRRSYLLASHYILEGLGAFRGLDEEARKRLKQMGYAPLANA